jgi:hypothetical protein
MNNTFKGIGTLHQPTFAVYGKERKNMLKERNKLKAFISKFPHYNSVNNDLHEIYGSQEHIITKEREAEILKQAQADLDSLNQKLQVPYVGGSEYMLKQIKEFNETNTRIQNALAEGKDIPEEWRQHIVSFQVRKNR